MARLIDANALMEAYLEEQKKPGTYSIAKMIMDAPTVDAVPIGVLDQVRWERDVAMQQLEEHGIPFGGIAPDVVKVVRCKDCKHYDKTTLGNNRDRRMCTKFLGLTIPNPDDFCSYGERKDND